MSAGEESATTIFSSFWKQKILSRLFLRFLTMLISCTFCVLKFLFSSISYFSHSDPLRIPFSLVQTCHCCLQLHFNSPGSFYLYLNLLTAESLLWHSIKFFLPSLGRGLRSLSELGSCCMYSVTSWNQDNIFLFSTSLSGLQLVKQSKCAQFKLNKLPYTYA